MAEQSLRNKTVSGVGWSAIDNVTNYAVTFIVSIVLARLLSPDDYGLIGIVTIFTTICTVLVGGGLSSAIIRKKDASEDDYSTAFITNLCMSVFLFVLIFFCAPLIARFFNRYELVSLTRVASLGLIIGALGIVQQTRLTKRIDFKTQTKISLIASFSSGIVGIAMALFGCGVWSLVVQGLLSQALRTILLWFFNHWVPSLRFSKRSFRDLFGFGWKLMLSSLLDSIWKDLYQVVVGKFYSPATLGQYSRAKGFSQLFSSNLTVVIQRVTYPVLSDIQGEKERLVAAYRRIIKTTMFVTAICMLALGAVSEPLLYCLIGAKWHEAATYLPLICIAGSLYPLHAINLNMLQLQGRSDLYLVLEVIKKIIGIAPLVVGALVGIMPMLYVNLLTGIICFFLNSIYSGKMIGYSSWRQIKDIAPSYTLALAVALSVYFLKYLPINNWVILSLQILVGATVFFVICHFSGLEEYKEIKKIVIPYISKFRSKGIGTVEEQ